MGGKASKNQIFHETLQISSFSNLRHVGSDKQLGAKFSLIISHQVWFSSKTHLHNKFCNEKPNPLDYYREQSSEIHSWTNAAKILGIFNEDLKLCEKQTTKRNYL